MEHDARRIDPAELRHEREESVPERERVPGMEPAVPELVDRPQGERAEVVELAHAADVEQRVAVDDSGNVPERDPEADSGDDRERAADRSRLLHAPERERQRDERDDAEQNDRQRQ